jgi:DNA-binding transcriptional ArsR family regulator
MWGKEELEIPKRMFIAKELAGLLGALAHPHRIRVIEELRDRELDVNSLQKILGISHSSVSQNLSILRAHRLVQERRDGRRVIYSLRQAALAPWLLGALDFLEADAAYSEEVRGAVSTVREMWSGNPEESPEEGAAEATAR